MGSGRKPKPTALKKAQGNPGKRKLRENEPSPPGARRLRIPTAPAFLGQHGKREWGRLGRILANLGLLTDSDLKSFAAYCAAWDQFVRAELALKRSGDVILLPSGRRVASPYIAIRNRADDRLRSWGSDFGLTPAARSRLHISASGDSPGASPTSDTERISKWLFEDHPGQETG